MCPSVSLLSLCWRSLLCIFPVIFVFLVFCSLRFVRVSSASVAIPGNIGVSVGPSRGWIICLSVVVPACHAACRCVGSGWVPLFAAPICYVIFPFVYRTFNPIILVVFVFTSFRLLPSRLVLRLSVPVACHHLWCLVSVFLIV